jgi:hypothetical protein
MYFHSTIPKLNTKCILQGMQLNCHVTATDSMRHSFPLLIHMQCVPATPKNSAGSTELYMKSGVGDTYIQNL